MILSAFDAMLRCDFLAKKWRKPGFVHDVFECLKCRSTQSYITPEQSSGFGGNRRDTKDRRSKVDTRSEVEKQLIGERLSRIDRRSNHDARGQPSKDQLSLFVRRVRHAMRDDKSRHFFGVAAAENDFCGYVEVLRTLKWIEDLARD
jgi:hypothetical protein